MQIHMHHKTEMGLPVPAMRLQMSPAQVLVLGYLVVILVGTGLLMLPHSTKDGEGLDFTTALFTATSGVCVTGLSVVDIGARLSLFGQVILLVLIEVGALGFMTMSTLFSLFLGRKITLRERMFIMEDLNHSYMSGIVRLVRNVVCVTFLIEGVGVLVLMPIFYPRYGWGKGVFYALFHGASAFANAGFSLLSSSLIDFIDHPTALLVMAGLVISGGLGFAVITDLVSMFHRRQMSLNSKIVLRMTTVLLLGGTLLILALEWGNPATLGKLDFDEKLLAGFFTSVTARTAGFEVVATGALRPVTVLVVMILMFIGASPGSAGGGIKTTTFAVIVYGTISVIKGKQEIDIVNRRISYEDFAKAVAITGLSLSLVVVVAVLLIVSQPHLRCLDLVLEAVSAFSTAGLSTGITGKITNPGRILLILTMFAGRVGPLTLAMALSRPKQSAINVRYPEEKISLG